MVSGALKVFVLFFSFQLFVRDVPSSILKPLLGKDGFEPWEGLLLQRTLDAMSVVFFFFGNVLLWFNIHMA